MRLHILSDLHIEFGKPRIVECECDLTILAGDIGVGVKTVDWITHNFPNNPVIYVLGNHEFYGQQIPDFIEDMRKKCRDSNIHLLENESVVFGGVEFFGCTLWTDFNLFDDPLRASYIARCNMNDFQVIKKESSVFKPQDSIEIHNESLKWLTQALQQSRAQKKAVITHHAPSKASISPQYQNDWLSAAFASNLETTILTETPDIWIHGHTHNVVDYYLGSTRIISNQHGYPKEHIPKFNPSYILEI